MRRFVPAGYLNPLVEIVGQRETGKSTLGVAAASIWSGDPTSDCGGGESWALTAASIDDVKRWHRDCCLFLDEGNAAAQRRDRSEFFTQAVFGLAATASKRRYGDLPKTAHNSLSFLSTTNQSLDDVVSEDKDVKDAMLSRVITARVSDDAPFGVLAVLPAGYETSRLAIEEMRAASDRNYGVVSRAYVRSLCRNAEHNEERLRRYIDLKLQAYLANASGLPGGARIHKSFALAYAAGRLAQQFKAIPSSWRLRDALLSIHRNVILREGSGNDENSRETISSYIEAHHPNMVTADQLRTMSKEEFETCDGSLLSHQGRPCLLVSGKALQRAYRDPRALVRRLCRAGLLKSEGGKQPKSMIYPPLPFRRVGRVYWIWRDTKKLGGDASKLAADQ